MCVPQICFISHCFSHCIFMRIILKLCMTVVCLLFSQFLTCFSYTFLILRKSVIDTFIVSFTVC